MALAAASAPTLSAEASTPEGRSEVWRLFRSPNNTDRIKDGLTPVDIFTTAGFTQIPKSELRDQRLASLISSDHVVMTNGSDQAILFFLKWTGEGRNTRTEWYRLEKANTGKYLLKGEGTDDSIGVITGMASFYATKAARARAEEILKGTTPFPALDPVVVEDE